MTLTELRYITTLARERHFGRAADKCHVSQPTLSVALKKVEQRIGALLFERSSNDVRLTPLGEQVAAQAERVLEGRPSWKRLRRRARIRWSGRCALASSTPSPPTCCRA